MKKIVAFSVMVIFFISHSYGQVRWNTDSIPVVGDSSVSQTGNGFNFTTFTEAKKMITLEIDSLTGKEYKSHPEYGVLPFNAPCQDCIELLQKRDETHRYFVKKGSKGKEFYAQSSFSHLNYRDENGVFQTIDKRIKPSKQPGVYTAKHQYAPTTINIPEKYTAISNAGEELQFNKDVNIFVQHEDGTVTSLGEPNWSDYSAGDDGILVHNFYPGIDLEIRVGNGNIESFYRLNKPLQLGDGWLVIRDNMKVPQGFIYDYTHSENISGPSDPSLNGANNYYEGTLFINSPDGEGYFYIGAPAAYDENNDHDNAINLNYRVTTNGVYDLYIPIAWMNNSKRSYPLIIDPFVTAISTLPKASITGSGYGNQCPPGQKFLNGCTYQLNVSVPAACTVTAITYSFNYRALGSCNLNQAGWDLTWGACRSPSTGPDTYHTCTIALPGLCILQNLSCFPDFQACLPPPQCSAYTIPMIMTFYRCVQPGVGCGFSCVNADTTWQMTVTGRIIEVVSHDTTVCLGSNVNLSATASWDVPPVTYTWYPGGLVGQTVTVNPVATTTYTVTANTCGGVNANDSAQTTATVTVFPNDNPGFIINPNPACAGNSVAISGLGAGPPVSYYWLLPGGTPAVQNSQQNVNVTYANAGNYNITLQWTSPTSGCIFDSILPITVNPGMIPSITIPPAGPICAGVNVTFAAISVNPGVTPTYQWFVNSVPVGGNQTTFSSTTLNNGDSIKVVLTASGIVCGSNVDTSNVIVMVVNPIVVPNVTITADPSGIICPGSNVTFTADTTNGNGGTDPTFQWQLNGSNAGTNSKTFSSNSLKTGDIITVIMTSNAPCPVPPTDTSNQIVMQVYPPVTVTTVGDTTICPGQLVTICATAANGNGGPYFYSWDNGGGNNNCANVSPVVTTIYTVSATDSCHTNPATGQVTVTVLPPPLANFTYSPSDISILTPTVHFTDLSSGDIAPWFWNFGDSATSTDHNPVHIYKSPGIYIITLVVTNSNGCMDSITYRLEIHDEYYFYIPNAFTPNGDGINDFFCPQGTDALQSLPLIYTMEIYNRWGEKIFETINTSYPWYGQVNDGTKIAEAGVYVYRITFQNPHFTNKVLVGSVALIR